MDELAWRYRRWHDADQIGRDDDADAACRAVMAAVMPPPPVPADFVSRTVAAVNAAREQDAAAARRMRRATVAASVVLSVLTVGAGGPWALSMVATVVAGGIDLFVNLAVSMATRMEAGGDVWTLLAGLGRASAALVAHPTVTVAILAMQGIAMAALLALHRLLGPERESLK